MRNYLNKQDKRAMNRIRKRNAELALLSDSNFQVNSGLEEVKKVKLMKGKEHGDDDQASIPGTSSVGLDLPGYARFLGQQVKETLADREIKRGFNVEPVMQLYKLQGRNLSEHEIAAFLHRMILGGNNCGKAGSDWIKFKGGKKPLQIVFIRINTDDQELVNTLSGASFMEGYFRHWIKLKPSAANRTKFWQTISTVTRSKYEMLLQKIKVHGDPLHRVNLSHRKVQMLMSLEQMVTSKFPFPTDFFVEQAYTGPKIRSTRKIYKQVSEASPIFVLDCEMCQTSVQQLELTRISVVNENGETVMDELVKPHNKIINYITFKSGITEKMLHNVFTRLKDIQQRLCSLLPSDGILCGHSLENDLRALQLSHPYCIDTSLLFNFSGRLHIRSGLKALAKIFLNEDIQESNNGHCSLQDALATWKLFKLKIERGLQFGNVALGWKFAEWAKANGMSITGTKLESIVLNNNEDSKTDDDITLDIKEEEIKEEINTSDNLLNDEVKVSKTSEIEVKEINKSDISLDDDGKFGEPPKNEVKMNEEINTGRSSEELPPNGSFNFEYFLI
ncbi:Exonuclease domain-containing protein [Meloidogyne graminicola]|uniref:Exonuclease domain-containing protein n=1 Tax=Meloidogyne graminicola TaxID=189291 RepID=A0A8S9ZFR5_9BILA|nr:Exonuclease domain-containing protein [Meloidogyne graminicola]